MRLRGLGRCAIAALVCFDLCGIAGAATTQPAVSTADVTAVPSTGRPQGWSHSFGANYPVGTVSTAYLRAPMDWEITGVDPSELLQKASCVLQVDQDTAGYNPNRLDVATMASLANSTVLVDERIKTVTGLPADQRSRVVVNSFATGPRFVRLEVLIRKGTADVKPGAAQNLMLSIIDGLRTAAAQSAQQTRRIDEQRRQAFQSKQQKILADLKDVRQRARQYRDQLAGVGNMYGDIDNTVTNLETQKRSIEQEISRYQARLGTMQPDAASAVIVQWQQIVDERQRELDAAKKQQGNAVDLLQLQQKLDDAKSKLQAAQLQAATARDSNQSFRLDQMTSLQSNIAEAQARLDPIVQQLNKLNDPAFQQLADQYPQLQQQEQQLNMQLNNLNAQLQQSSQVSDDDQVTITILGGAEEH